MSLLWLRSSYDGIQVIFCTSVCRDGYALALKEENFIKNRQLGSRGGQVIQDGVVLLCSISMTGYKKWSLVTEIDGI